MCVMYLMKTIQIILDESKYQTISYSHNYLEGFLGGTDGKESACNVGDSGLIPGSGRSPRVWQPTPASLPGESQGQEAPGWEQFMGSQRAGHNRLSV